MSDKQPEAPVWRDVPSVQRSHGLSRYLLGKLIDAGEITASKVGDKTLINIPSVEACLARARIKRMADLANAAEMRRRRRLGIERARERKRLAELAGATGASAILKRPESQAA
jgi:hypothetical protein